MSSGAEAEQESTCLVCTRPCLIPTTWGKKAMGSVVQEEFSVVTKPGPHCEGHSAEQALKYDTRAKVEISSSTLSSNAPSGSCGRGRGPQEAPNRAGLVPGRGLRGEVAGGVRHGACGAHRGVHRSNRCVLVLW